jgi:hypothetical protein
VPANPNARVQLVKNTTTSGGNVNETLTYEPDLSNPPTGVAASTSWRSPPVPS